MATKRTAGLLEELNQKVKDACPAQMSGCDELDSCEELLVKSAAFLACAAAQEELNAVCFKGGNGGHREKAKGMRNASARCVGYYINNPDCH